jgi:hypothetical protein
MMHLIFTPEFSEETHVGVCTEDHETAPEIIQVPAGQAVYKPMGP